MILVKYSKSSTFVVPRLSTRLLGPWQREAFAQPWPRQPLAPLFLWSFLGGLLLLASAAAAATRYVNMNNPAPAAPYTNWATAARVIQDAVDVAVAGDEIVVTNGTYATGGRAVGTNLLVNRVAVDKALTLRSMNGPHFTTILGHQLRGITDGDGAIRCIYLTNGAKLLGFTLSRGATRDWTTRDERQMNGGGAWCESASAVISNCAVVQNSARAYGGGICSGTIVDCKLSGNSAWFGGGAYGSTLSRCAVITNWASVGGGAYGSALSNCVLAGNTADVGGGAFKATLRNCTLTGNSAKVGGGVFAGKLDNCIVYFNTALCEENYSSKSTLNFCCTLPQPTNGVGNTTGNPLFVNQAKGNLRLRHNSPCINSGTNACAAGQNDLAGRQRIADGVVDIGAYELQVIAGPLSADEQPDLRN